MVLSYKNLPTNKRVGIPRGNYFSNNEDYFNCKRVVAKKFFLIDILKLFKPRRLMVY